MGIKRQRLGLANALFSRVQLRVLGLFFGQPDRTYKITEVIQLAGSGRGAVQRALKKLTAARILNAKIHGTHKHYQANRESPIFAELHGLILKTVGLVEPLRNALNPYRQEINVAFVYGSAAKGTDTAMSDIDLMIIGRELGYSEIFGTLQKAESTLLRQVNPNLMTPEEWKQRIADQNSFVRTLQQQPKLFVIGTENELEGIGESC